MIRVGALEMWIIITVVFPALLFWIWYMNRLGYFDRMKESNAEKYSRLLKEGKVDEHYGLDEDDYDRLREGEEDYPYEDEEDERRQKEWENDPENWEEEKDEEDFMMFEEEEEF